jgi:hypothetical protein
MLQKYLAVYPEDDEEGTSWKAKSPPAWSS